MILVIQVWIGRVVGPSSGTSWHILFARGNIIASFPGPLREFRTASDERAGPGNEARNITVRGN